MSLALILAGSFGATILLGPVGPAVAAQEHEEEQHAEAEAGEHEEHDFHRHHLSVFLGATTADVEVHGGEGDAETQSEGGETTRETEASIGLDYEYRLNRTWGVGFLFDYVAGDARTSVAGIPVFLHPAGGLKLLAAPGIEHHEGENEFLVRLGLGYQFDVGRWQSLQVPASTSWTVKRPMSTASTSAEGFDRATER